MLLTRRHFLHSMAGAALFAICGPRDESQDVETYDGSLGVSRAFVDAHQSAVGQLQWLDDLGERFEVPGTVSGERWGSGALVGPDLFLTAGHCFDGDQARHGWIVPQRRGKPIPPAEIARSMRVVFGYQIDGATGETRPGIPFPIVELLEHRRGGVDYALVRLGGKPPGSRLALAKRDLTTPGARLCIIQHPNRQQKKVATGTLLTNDGKRITYADIDTAGFASGSPVLAESGAIAGVHVFGGCGLRSPEIGFNYGVAAGAIRRASKLL